MRQKINRDDLEFKISNLKFPVFILLILLLLYSRFVNIGWGLPYPMHPDERNMANAIQQLECNFSFSNFHISNLKECLNPHFYAYGQLPLFLGYIIVWILKFWDGDVGWPIGFQEATLSLRIISAFFSVILAFVLYKIIYYIQKYISEFEKILIFLLLIFLPYSIQLAHFGTTETLLMLFYSLIIFYSLKLIDEKNEFKNLPLTAIFIGLATATKISSLIFIFIPLMAMGLRLKFRKILKLEKKFIFLLISFFVIIISTTVFFSPHNLLHYQDFISSLQYESDVALGKYITFYTRQFMDTIPIWFQLNKIFPYAMGWGMSSISLIGLIWIGWKNRKINFLRLTFFVYFLPTAFIFAKWTRFMAPIFPVLTIFAVLLVLNIKRKILGLRKNYQQTLNFLILILFTFFLIPGIKYLNLYQRPDIRFLASEWIYKNIPENSYILSETANVVDIPVETDSLRTYIRNYQLISFNFYDLDENIFLQDELKFHINKADYIIIPSRRIFANLNNRFPLLQHYYSDLFSGRLGFQKVAEFSTGLNDEQAEETWTVFDHPVIRIFKRVKN